MRFNLARFCRSPSECAAFLWRRVFPIEKCMVMKRSSNALRGRRGRKGFKLALLFLLGGVLFGGLRYASTGDGPERSKGNAAADVLEASPGRALRQGKDETLQPPLEWIEFVTGGADENEALPLVLAIHGLGDRPEDFAVLFDGLEAKARFVIPRAPRPYYGGYGWTLERASGGDLEALRRELNVRAEQLETLLAAQLKTKKTLGAPIAIGFSQGAMLTYLLATRAEPILGVAIPIAGLLLDEARLEKRAPKEAPRIHAFHGDADPLIPFATGERTARKLAQRGYTITFHRGAGVPHRIPGAYRDTIMRTLKRAIDEVGVQ